MPYSNTMTVRATDDHDEGFDEHGFIESFYIYTVVEHDIDPNLGTLTYDVRIPDLGEYRGLAPAPQPSGSSTFEPYNRGYVYDDEIDELRAKGVAITFLPRVAMSEAAA